MKKILILPLLIFIVFITAACSSDNNDTLNLNENNDEIINNELNESIEEDNDENIEEDVNEENGSEKIDSEKDLNEEVNKNNKETKDNKEGVSEDKELGDERAFMEKDGDLKNGGQIIPVEKENLENKDNSEEAIFCAMDVKECPDGSFVSRVAPSCEFAPCPEGGEVKEE
jgi:hypothetical protein